jgi:hypothetical protein
MDRVIVIEPNPEEFIEEYDNVENWSGRDNAVEVSNVVKFSHVKNDGGCKVEVKYNGEIHFSKGSEVISGY